MNRNTGSAVGDDVGVVAATSPVDAHYSEKSLNLLLSVYNRAAEALVEDREDLYEAVKRHNQGLVDALKSAMRGQCALWCFCCSRKVPMGDMHLVCDEHRYQERDSDGDSIWRNDRQLIFGCTACVGVVKSYQYNIPGRGSYDQSYRVCDGVDPKSVLGNEYQICHYPQEVFGLVLMAFGIQGEILWLEPADDQTRFEFVRQGYPVAVDWMMDLFIESIESPAATGKGGGSSGS